MSAPIRNVVVVGASGAIGRPIVNALMEGGFVVTALTRESSKTTFPQGVRAINTDYGSSSLAEVFKEQDAVVSTLGFTGLQSQISLIDAAIAAGVKVFLPSEFGLDTASPNAIQTIPGIKVKIDTVEYLKSVQDKISWTAVVTGALFDWGFDYPGVGGWNVPARTAVIWDGGNIPFEATNLTQTGKAIVAILKNPESSKNRPIYINSFTTTQNDVLRTLEKAVGEKFRVTNASVEETWKAGMEKAARGGEGQRDGVIATIHAGYYGKGNMNHYSATRGLWNERLGLTQEDIGESIRAILASRK
ncbi:uncharacterized protein A1O9_12767 [Exophiala aquamarina CBS 119918]|uniref:NmrA-like domain-containing protein n=1 Tax=Exophiala aquamarina CBS 119918 TaxID=1182545 RepID=A0A072NVU7_9EURO|nr:uncharacterized protein A1O9_12767 [Exophiala aquamarina CBS 119918]KEF51153.1 hypothetical protein A1O9_12767 [Exophiala aquamarina CBS 119918]